MEIELVIYDAPIDASCAQGCFDDCLKAEGIATDQPLGTLLRRILRMCCRDANQPEAVLTYNIPACAAVRRNTKS